MASEQWKDHPTHSQHKVQAARSAVKTYNMITHSNKQIEEHFASLLHLSLHRAAPLEGAAAADDESEVVGTEL